MSKAELSACAYYAPCNLSEQHAEPEVQEYRQMIFEFTANSKGYVNGVSVIPGSSGDPAAVCRIKQILTRVMKSFLSVILNRLQELHFDEMHMKSKEPCGCEYPGCIDLSKFFQCPDE